MTKANLIYILSCRCVLLDWHQYDGIAKPDRGFSAKYSSAVSSAVGSVTSLYTSEYDSLCQLAALASFPVLKGLETLNDRGVVSMKSAEQILQEFDCCIHCIEKSFLTNTSGKPMGHKFLKQVICSVCFSVCRPHLLLTQQLEKL